MNKAQWRAFAIVYWALCLGFIFLVLPQLKPQEPDWVAIEKQQVEERLRFSKARGPDYLHRPQAVRSLSSGQ